MALLSLRNLTLSYGGQPLLHDTNLQIEPGERVALVGRNGAGKTTLLRLLAGAIAPQEGEISWQKGARRALLQQDAPALDGTVFDIVANPPADGLSSDTEPGEMIPEHEVRAVLSRLKLDGEKSYSALSGGQKRRTLLARALVNRPDLLLLDEPTNHLDIPSIEWLEEFLPRSVKTLLFVTHDRAFLRALATRIVEVDRGKLISYACTYEQFLERREAALEAEAHRNTTFDRKMAEEEAWLRRGVKARLTRDEGRVRALMQMRDERQARRSLAGTASLLTHAADRSGHLVAETVNAGFAIGEHPIVQPFSTTILRGDRVGIIGPNGSGKTTLLRGLLGEIAPQTGSAKLGTRLQIAYFDQMRAALDLQKSARYNVAGENETVTIDGKPRHIVGYLRAFGFAPERIRQSTGTLSGGERNRLLLAKLFTQPSNLLVMDEPTNDLDIETLEVLEELLSTYPGTLLLVSHDRDFLNNVVTSTIALEPDENGMGARVYENIGGYDDYERVRQVQLRPVQTGKKTETATNTKETPKAPTSTEPRKLSFKEKRELEALPGRIESLETEQQQLYERMSDPAFYRDGDGDEATSTKARLEAIEAELTTAFARWEALEALA